MDRETALLKQEVEKLKNSFNSLKNYFNNKVNEIILRLDSIAKNKSKKQKE